MVTQTDIKFGISKMCTCHTVIVSWEHGDDVDALVWRHGLERPKKRRGWWSVLKPTTPIYVVLRVYIDIYTLRRDLLIINKFFFLYKNHKNRIVFTQRPSTWQFNRTFSRNFNPSASAQINCATPFRFFHLVGRPRAAYISNMRTKSTGCPARIIPLRHFLAW